RTNRQVAQQPMPYWLDREELSPPPSASLIAGIASATLSSASFMAERYLTSASGLFNAQISPCRFNSTLCCRNNSLMVGGASANAFWDDKNNKRTAIRSRRIRTLMRQNYARLGCNGV